MRALRCAVIAPFLFSMVAVGQAPHCLTDSLMHRQFGELGPLLDELSSAIAPVASTNRGGEPTVPVVVHVVWNTAAENIPDAVVQAFVLQLDQDFNQMNPNLGTVRPAFTSSIADVGIRFCLAQTDPSGNPTTGITRTFTSTTWFDPNNQPHSMKGPPNGISAWDPTRYLNIWVCDIVGSSGNIVSGYTYLPVGGMVGSWQDGLVIDYYYGTQPSARTPTHEAGHYFGLRHTFDGNSCSADDGFADTPNTNSPTWNCSNTSLMKCGVLTQYENYMDYSGCTAMFTQQQASYMSGVLNGVRSSLLSSGACQAGPTAVGDRSVPVVTAHPNPASDWISVSTGGVMAGQMMITDGTGRTMLQQAVHAEPLVIDVSGFDAGVYHLRLENATSTVVRQFIVAR